MGCKLVSEAKLDKEVKNCRFCPSVAGGVSLGGPKEGTAFKMKMPTSTLKLQTSGPCMLQAESLGPQEQHPVPVGKPAVSLSRRNYLLCLTSSDTA